jgi:hypothetical protein
MARVDSDEVKELIATTETITAQINAANVLITEVLGSETTITTDHLKELERWVAAHLVACSIERQGVEEKIGGTTVKYVGNADREARNLNLTSYGQQAIMLDTTGRLASLGGRKARVDTVDAIDMT